MVIGSLAGTWATVVAGTRARWPVRVSRTWLSRCAPVLLVMAAGSAARADQEVVELRYSAPPGCPSRAAFEAEILERTQRVRFAAEHSPEQPPARGSGSTAGDPRNPICRGCTGSGPSAAPARRVFAVTVETTADGFRGTLAVDRTSDKELAAPRCEDLTTALALVTALAIDPTATLTPRARPPRPEPPRRRAWQLELDADAMVETGAGPGALLAAAIEARASWRDGYAIELAAIAGRDSIARDDAEAQFTWLAARPAACRSSPVQDVTVDVCGHVEIGAVRAHGEMIVNQRDLTRLWLAAGLHATARLAFGSRGFGLLQLGASLPLVRDHYLFAPDVDIHDTPSVTGWLVVGVGVRFP